MGLWGGGDGESKQNIIQIKKLFKLYQKINYKIFFSIFFLMTIVKKLFPI